MMFDVYDTFAVVTQCPIGVPTKVGMEWFYRTKEALFVLRTVNNDELLMTEPVWIFVGRLDVPNQSTHKQ